MLFRSVVSVNGESPNAKVPVETGFDRVAKQAHPTQEKLILQEIRLESLNPLKLPKYRRGKQNVKADIRSVLRRKNPRDFGSDKVFDLAWDRLRRSKEIRDS